MKSFQEFLDEQSKTIILDPSDYDDMEEVSKTFRQYFKGDRWDIIEVFVNAYEDFVRKRQADITKAGWNKFQKSKDFKKYVANTLLDFEIDYDTFMPNLDTYLKYFNNMLNEVFLNIAFSVTLITIHV